MKTVCLYFQVHQPWRLKVYRFFNIGKDHNYLDDFTNRAIMQKVARQCYLPMNALLLKLIKENKGAFKCSFSITGSAVEQFRAYAPEVLDSFRALAETGCVEFLAETYSHSLAALSSKEDFTEQVKLHTKMIKEEFGKKPVAFRNTELIYSDQIGEMVSELGFKTILAEGARHVMGWKSPNYIYTNSIDNRLRVLLRNYKLSDDIAFRFSNQGWDQYPLTADKFAQWVKEDNGDVVNLFMDYETFGEHQKAASGIFDFMRYFPETVLADGEFDFVTPTQAAKKHRPVGDLDVMDPISWADEERDVTAWLGNELQNDAFNKLNEQAEKLALLNDEALWSDFGHLQESDHFYYMCTKFFSDGAVHKYFNPYDTPYEAFINYMNVLSDFILRVDDAISVSDVNFAAEKQVKAPVKKAPAKKAATKKAPAKKPAAKKTTKK